jgi:hypothetical protein
VDKNQAARSLDKAEEVYRAAICPQPEIKTTDEHVTCVFDVMNGMANDEKVNPAIPTNIQNSLRRAMVKSNIMKELCGEPPNFSKLIGSVGIFDKLWLGSQAGKACDSLMKLMEQKTVEDWAKMMHTITTQCG